MGETYSSFPDCFKLPWAPVCGDVFYRSMRSLLSTGGLIRSRSYLVTFSFDGFRYINTFTVDNKLVLFLTGVDDMFVLMACWDDLTEEQKRLPLHERVGLMLKHGGVSITVTSVTDILAFIVGSSTVSRHQCTW